MAVISSEENMARLEELRAIAKKLRDPRTLPSAEAEKLAKEGKIIVLVTCSLHASEIAASQMSMELAYKLVTGDTPFDAAAVLHDVVVLLVPSINPDGHQMEVDWYRKYLGTKYEGGSMPWLYHHYAGHDNNRDWFMFNLAETRAVTRVLYHDWLPQIHLDEHQMGSDEARLFIPPFMNPPVPNVQPLVWRGVNLLGANMAYDLQQRGFKGVEHGRSFTGWWIGACDDTSWLHNVVGLLSEMASVRLATPIFIEPTEIPKAYTKKRMEFPDPWPGGWWRLRDIVDYELTLSLQPAPDGLPPQGGIPPQFLPDVQERGRDDRQGQPYAFVIPADQHDYPTMLKMLDVLKFGGVEIHRAAKDFTADGTTLSGRVVRRPAGPALQALRLGPARAAEISRHPANTPAARPSRPTTTPAGPCPCRWAWPATRSTSPSRRSSEKIDTVPYPRRHASGRRRRRYLVLDARSQRLLRRGLRAAQGQGGNLPVQGEDHRAGFEAAAGSFIVKNGARGQESASGASGEAPPQGLSPDRRGRDPERPPSRIPASGSTNPGGRTWTRAGRATSSTTSAFPTPPSATSTSRPPRPPPEQSRKPQPPPRDRQGRP